MAKARRHARRMSGATQQSAALGAPRGAGKPSRPESIPYLSDQPNPHSGLFDVNASAVAKIICQSELGTGFTVGVFGAWGRGKTSLLRSIEAKIQNHGMRWDDSGSTVTNVCIDFDAWRYDEASQVTLALYQTILDTVGKDLAHNKSLPRVQKALKGVLSVATVLGYSIGLASKLTNPAMLIGDIAESVANVTGAVPVGESGSNGGAKQAPTKQAPAQEVSLVDGVRHLKDLSSALVEERIRLIVFIDDLDRCAPETVASLIRGIGSCMDVSNIVYVLALDRDYLINVINAQYATGMSRAEQQRGVGASAYSESFGERFLEKIIQVPVFVPTISFADGGAQQLHEVLGTEAGRYFIEYYVGETVESCLTTAIIPYALRNNPRQVKRLLNSFFYGSYVNWDKLRAVGDDEAQYQASKQYLFMLGLKQAAYALYEGIRSELAMREGDDGQDMVANLEDLDVVSDFFGNAENAGDTKLQHGTSKQPDGAWQQAGAPQQARGSQHAGAWQQAGASQHTNRLLELFVHDFCSNVRPEDFMRLDDIVASDGEQSQEDAAVNIKPVIRRDFQDIMADLPPNDALRVAVESLTSFFTERGLEAETRKTGRWFSLAAGTSRGDMAASPRDAAVHRDVAASHRDVAAVHRDVAVVHRDVAALTFTSASAREVHIYVRPMGSVGKAYAERLDSGEISSDGYVRNMENLGHKTGFGTLEVRVKLSQAKDLPPEVAALLEDEIKAAS